MANMNEEVPRNINEVVRDFRLREDASLALALQDAEINEYYNQNKQRNALLRIDYPKALTEQMKENECAVRLAEKQRKLQRQQELLDEEMAKQIADQLRKERRLKQQREASHSQNIPLDFADVSYQEEISVGQIRQINLIQHTPEKQIQKTSHNLNTNSIEVLNNNFSRNCMLDQIDVDIDVAEPINYASNERIRTMEELGIDQREIFEIDKRIEQELKDQQLARQIQEEMCSMTQEEVDRKIAMEAQDKEVAKMLYSREKAKLKKAREKARMKREMQTRNNNTSGTPEIGDQLVKSNSSSNSPEVPREEFMREDYYTNPADMIQSTHKRVPSEEIYLSPVDECSSNVLQNEPRSRSAFHENLPSTFETALIGDERRNDRFLLQESSPVPPYMPIQGTRRNQELSKKKKERCSQQ